MPSNKSDEIFQYTGRETVPKDVTIVHFHCNVTSIDVETFYECSKLKEVVLNNGLQTVGKKAFAQCKSLERITLPCTVTSIGMEAFFDCTSLKELVLNEGIQKIYPQAFERCKSLQSITIPSSMVEIGRFTFNDCKCLREVFLNEGLQKIGVNAFSCCHSLQSITIPSTVTYIGLASFQNCSELREVVCIEGLPEIESNTFIGCLSLERITFPNLSTRLEAVIQAGQVDVQNKIQQHINRDEIEWKRGGTIYILVDVTRSGEGWDLVKLQLRVDQIVKWTKYYEMKEATTLFELALWKTKIDQVEDDDVHACDRGASRIDVPGPVKDTIIQYIDIY